MNVQKYLQEQDVPYEVIAHNATYDAQRMSQALHVSGHHVAKTVLLKTPAGYAVAVLPATTAVDLAQAKKALGVSAAQLASEEELSQHCRDCEVGALPPFGSQYGMRTVVDERLAEDTDILFEGNTHNESVKMRFGDFSRLEKPIVALIAAPAVAK
jgi:Ala-tRNA(Pro) deacylase